MTDTFAAIPPPLPFSLGLSVSGLTPPPLSLVQKMQRRHTTTKPQTAKPREQTPAGQNQRANAAAVGVMWAGEP